MLGWVVRGERGEREREKETGGAHLLTGADGERERGADLTATQRRNASQHGEDTHTPRRCVERVVRKSRSVLAELATRSAEGSLGAFELNGKY